MNAALDPQPDLFIAATELPIARTHEHNPRAMDESDCHIEHVRAERYECGIKIARSERGYHHATYYRTLTAYSGGPVFYSAPPAPTFDAARHQAYANLIAKLRDIRNDQAGEIRARRLLIAAARRAASQPAHQSSLSRTL